MEDLPEKKNKASNEMIEIRKKKTYTQNDNLKKLAIRSRAMRFQRKKCKTKSLDSIHEKLINSKKNNIRYSTAPLYGKQRNNSAFFEINIPKLLENDLIENKNKINCEKNNNLKNSSEKEIDNYLNNNYKKNCSMAFTSEGKLTIPIKTKNIYQKEDFKVISLCGKGAYGTVLQVKLKTDNSDKYYAIKVIDVNSMLRVNKLYQIYLEAEILYELNSPFIVNFYGAFEQKGKVYLIMDYISKGDFSTFLKMNHPLKDETIRFYSAEIVLFLEYLQSKKIVHRDLKPENIMIKDNYHLQVIDFATIRKIGYYYDKNEMRFKKDLDFDIENNEDAKGTKLVVNPDRIDDENSDSDSEDEEIKKKKRRRNVTFVGTEEYVSPEVIGDKPAGFGADIWALGIMLYQMYFGVTPFKSSTMYLTFRKIETPLISFPYDVNTVPFSTIPTDAMDLISKILIKIPNQRLGAGEPGSKYDIEHLKKHPFFKNINWDNLIKESPPFMSEFKFKEKKIAPKNQDKKSDEKIDDNKNVTILKQGFLLKKSFWFSYNRRYFILDSTPKIIYREPDKDGDKGIMYLDKNSQIFLVSADIMKITNNRLEFKLKAANRHTAVEWINAVRDAIKKYSKE